MEKQEQIDIVRTAMGMIQEASHPSVSFKMVISLMNSLEKLARHLEKEEMAKKQEG